jgi:hypothetical protein
VRERGPTMEAFLALVVFAAVIFFLYKGGTGESNHIGE